MEKVCKRCGKIDSTASKTGYCKKCQAQEKEEYAIVKDYVRLNPNAKVIEVHKRTGVSLKVIDRMVKNGGLILVENPDDNQGN